MSNNKQSSVEWLFHKINDALIDFTEGKISASIYGIRVTEYKYKAKEMHKQEIIECWHNGYNNQSPMIDEENCGEQYYNETFE